MAKKLYNLPEGRYDPTFIKAMAMAIHIEKLEPAELEFWMDENWPQVKMAKELYRRVKEHKDIRDKMFDGSYREEYEE